MDFRDAVRSGLDEYLMDLKATLDGLTPEERRYQPTSESNHIDWLVWHMARVEDAWVTRTGGQTSVWELGGWGDRFGIDIDGAQSGNGQTMDQVVNLPQYSMADMLEYYDAVRDRTYEFLDDFTTEDLERETEHHRRGTVNGAWILGHMTVEESRHLGQIGYLRGMQRGLNG